MKTSKYIKILKLTVLIITGLSHYALLETVNTAKAAGRRFETRNKQIQETITDENENTWNQFPKGISPKMKLGSINHQN
jgi:hypothetical protein